MIFLFFLGFFSFFVHRWSLSYWVMGLPNLWDHRRQTHTKRFKSPQRRVDVSPTNPRLIGRERTLITVIQITCQTYANNLLHCCLSVKRKVLTHPTPPHSQCRLHVMCGHTLCTLHCTVSNGNGIRSTHNDDMRLQNYIDFIIIIKLRFTFNSFEFWSLMWWPCSD